MIQEHISSMFKNCYRIEMNNIIYETYLTIIHNKFYRFGTPVSITT